MVSTEAPPAVVAYQMARKLGITDLPSPKRKAIQAKHISDEEVLAAHRAYAADVERRKQTYGGHPTEWIWTKGDVPNATQALCTRYPWKVVLAKQLSMERRGLLAPLTTQTWMLPDGS